VNLWAGRVHSNATLAKAVCCFNQDGEVGVDCDTSMLFSLAISAYQPITLRRSVSTLHLLIAVLRLSVIQRQLSFARSSLRLLRLSLSAE